MSSFSSLTVVTRPVGLPTDPLTRCFQAVAVHGGRLAVALLNQHDPGNLAAALAEARTALNWAESRSAEVVAALEPATNDEIEAELTRLVRSWPQDKRGDLAGYGAELAIFVVELRPTRRALEQACRGLKLDRVHMPSIAEVMASLTAAEGALAAAAQQLSALPARIARAEAALAPSPPRGPVQPRATLKTDAVASL